MNDGPWDYRHPKLCGLLIGAVLGLIVTGIVFAWITPITIPLLVLLVPVLLSTWLIYTGIRCNKAQRQREREHDAELRRHQAQQPAPIDLALAGADGDLICDADRLAVLEVLGDAFAAGYLDHDMYEQRSSQAMQARRRSDLRPPLIDLPVRTTQSGRGGHGRLLKQVRDLSC